MTSTVPPAPRPRARDLGIPFDGETGPQNAVTDVAGVEVGVTTLVHGDGEHAVRTGVTAVLPRGRDGVGDPCTAGVSSLNGNGELTGAHWIEEAGMLHLPVAVTNSHAVGTAHRGIVDWVASRRPDVAREWLLPVAAETYDGDLNDINGAHVTTAHVVAALDGAASGPVAEGSVGGGTGMSCYSFKGGNGTASRTVGYGDEQYTVGVLLQANFGSRAELTVAGVPVGRRLDAPNPFETGAAPRPPGGGSVIVVVATDAPLLAGQCKALARRVPLGLARTGTTGSHFSGDVFLAFSTGNAGGLTTGYATARPIGGYDALRLVPWPHLDPFYAAVVQAVEEAVVNSLVASETMTGRNGFTSPGLPVDQLLDLLRQAGRI